MGAGTSLKSALWLHIFVPQMLKQIPSAEKQTNYLRTNCNFVSIESWLTPSAPCFSSTPKSCSCSWEVSMKSNMHLKQSCNWRSTERKMKGCQIDIITKKSKCSRKIWHNEASCSARLPVVSVSFFSRIAISKPTKLQDYRFHAFYHSWWHWDGFEIWTSTGHHHKIPRVIGRFAGVNKCNSTYSPYFFLETATAVFFLAPTAVIFFLWVKRL